MTDTYTPHRFIPQVAEIYGIPAALIYQYIQYRSERMTTRWVDLTLEHVCKQYPYFGRNQVWAAMQKLIHSGKKTPSLVLRKQVGGAYLYAPIAKNNCTSLHTFDVRIAMKAGVVAAVIYHNIGFWIKRNWMQKAETLYEHLNPAEFDDCDTMMQRFAYQHTRKAAAHHGTVAEWVKHHAYIPQRSAERGFSCLLKLGLLKAAPTSRRKPLWYLPRKLLAEFENEMLSKSHLENDTAKTKCSPPKSKTHRQNLTRAAKTKRQIESRGLAADGYSAVVEADVVEAVLRIEKPLEDHYTAFPLPSLADARDGQAGTAVDAASPRPSAEVWKKVEKLNRASLPAPVKKKVLKDFFGHPVKRQYVRKPKPEDDDFDLYVDDLSPEARRKYLASFR